MYRYSYEYNSAIVLTHFNYYSYNGYIRYSVYCKIPDLFESVHFRYVNMESIVLLTLCKHGVYKTCLGRDGS